MNVTETILHYIEHDIRWYAISLHNGCRYDAEDTLQDLAFNVFKDLSYFYGKTEQHIKNILRLRLIEAKIHRGRSDTARVKREQKKAASIKYTVDSDAWGNMEKRRLQSALLKLSKDESCMFRLRLDGYQPHELIPIGKTSVALTIFRIKNKLIKQLKAA